MTASALMRTLLALLATSLVWAPLAAGEGDAPDFKSVYEQLQQLAGNWHGIQKEQGRETAVNYRLTGGGSALIETWGKGEQGSMSTVYHLDGEDLRLTHYCGAKNQPRMRAVSYDPSKGVIRFDFVDVTNLSAPDAYYTSQVILTLKDQDHIEVKFSGKRQEEMLISTYSLTRVQE